MQSFIDQWLPIFYEAIKDTFLMVAISLAFSVLIGIILAIILILTRPGQPLQNKFVYQFFNLLINVIRSIPFIILLFFYASIHQIRSRHLYWCGRSYCTTRC